ncbi:Hexosaminidase Dlike [Caligus rogercresseyi]|uniref:beta-N-acetylhexosaminidase n=1 Tax=Caligus rogercresseyi TaxID=217165 RepID=A0A7T8K9H6_CALRO|nr:Hexosaminidase Dlike [Caligus rogercresseyi]
MVSVYAIGRRKVYSLLFFLFALCILLPSVFNLFDGSEEEGSSSLQHDFDGDKLIFQVRESKEKIEMEGGGTNRERSSLRFIPQERVVHFDLKGSPPKVSYLKYVLPLIREAGATAILLEYEDMFPYWGPLKNISSPAAYSRAELKDILKSARENNLEVIPLIQTFGHMEHVLKLKEFADLREVPIYPQSICPSQEKSFEVITQMIDQVFSLHPRSKWLHIGLDEVYQLGQCTLCSERINKANANPDFTSYQDGRTLFLQHAHRVASYVRKSKGIIPIMWDDMFRSFPAHSLLDSGIGELVEPMVWVYIEDIDRFVDSSTWSAYADVFKYVWAASAYKGAFGERMFMVNIQRHVGNHLSWLEIMGRESSKGDSLDSGSQRPIQFRGIALSGWSRYDHFAVLCELLPPALPSLILNLNILSRGGHDEEVIRKTSNLLECPGLKSSLTPESFLRDPFQGELSRCRFLGSNLYALMSSYNSNKKEVESIFDRVDNQEGWMTHYNVKYGYSSPYRVHETMKSVSFFPGILRSLENQLSKTLAQYYDEPVVEEWIEQHILPLEEKYRTWRTELKY